MAGRNYERLSIEEFGTHLLESGDLDPVYIALWQLLRKNGTGRSLWKEDQVKRWLVAYWCLYHVGSACYLSTLYGHAFWAELMKAAVNEEPAPVGGRWPRGHERRHFRGQHAVQAVTDLQNRYDEPEAMVDFIMAQEGEGSLPFHVVSERVRTHNRFGPWMAFKACDMVERVFGFPVDFNEAAVFMFKDPAEAAIRLWRLKMKMPDGAQPKDRGKAIHAVVEYLVEFFKGFNAPPDYVRRVGLQEIETILCKWKSHQNGHYPLWNDIDEINEGLAPWAEHTQAAAQFLGQMPRREQ